MPVLAWGTQILSRAFGGERALGLAGCAMACASGTFALYMAAHGPASGFTGGGRYLTVFAQFGGGRDAGQAPAGPIQPASAPVVPVDIDPVVTGSIPARFQKTSTAASPGGERPVLANMALRQVDGDSALVEVNDRLGIYRIGDQIPGGGQLLAITQQGGRPALETSKGLIIE